MRDGEIEPVELRAALKAKRRVLLIDVREAEERKLANFRGSIHIPLRDLHARVAEVRQLLTQPFDLCVVFCRVGARSGLAIEYLAAEGIQGLLNLRGGINAYAQETDSRMNPY